MSTAMQVAQMAASKLLHTAPALSASQTGANKVTDYFDKIADERGDVQLTILNMGIALPSPRPTQPEQSALPSYDVKDYFDKIARGRKYFKTNSLVFQGYSLRLQRELAEVQAKISSYDDQLLRIDWQLRVLDSPKECPDMPQWQMTRVRQGLEQEKAQLIHLRNAQLAERREIVEELEKAA